MIKEFEKYAGFRVLRLFIFNPGAEMYIKEVAKKLNISPSTAKFNCDLFLKEGFFNVAEKGNLKIFSLDNGSVYVRELKRLFALLAFREAGIERMLKGGMSLAIYGSHASGEFNEDSDVDIIIIGAEKQADRGFILSFEKKTGKQVQLTVIPYHKWEMMKRRRDVFASEVLRNHILIKGAEL